MAEEMGEDEKVDVEVWGVLVGSSYEGESEGLSVGNKGE